MAGDARGLPALPDRLRRAAGLAGSPGRPRRCTASCATQCRIAAGRSPSPTAAVIDSQSVKAAETVARASRGYDAGKKINGRKRHIAVDTIGLLLTVLVTAAGVQDRDGARPLLWNLRRPSRDQARLGRQRLRRQAGHLGDDRPQAHRSRSSSAPSQHTFNVLPRRWVVERTLAWITRPAAPSATTNACPSTTRRSSTGP